MIRLESFEFGKPITLDSAPGAKHNEMGAHGMISQFLKLKKSYKTFLEDLTKGDSDATRFYCKDDCAYIFNIDIMRAIVSAVDQNTDAEKDSEGKAKGCVVLFQGVRKAFDKGNPEDGCPFGRPTLIATAYIQVKDGDQKSKLKYIRIPASLNPWKELKEIDAFEHPGDGNSNPTIPLKDKDYTGAVVHRIDDDEMADTDYEIKKELKEEALKGWRSGDVK